MSRGYNRLGIFAMYSEDGVVDDYIIFLLDKMLEEVLSELIVVSNGPIKDEYYKKLEKRTTSIYLREDRGFDGGAYQDLFLNLCSDKKWGCYDEIVLFNDSFYGPIHSMKHTFEMMEKKNYDFWGMLYCRFDDEEIYKYGFNTFFVVFSNSVIKDESFVEYWRGMKEETYYGRPGCFERTITMYFESKGFSHGSVLNENGWKESVLEKYPRWGYDAKDMLDEYSLPVLKCRALSIFHYENTKGVLKYIKNETEYDVNLIENHRDRLSKKNQLGDYTEKQLEDFVKEHNNIYIYGHGQYGMSLKEYFKDHNWDVAGFLVSKDALGDEICIDDFELDHLDGIVVALAPDKIMQIKDKVKRIPERQLLMYGHRSL